MKINSMSTQIFVFCLRLFVDIVHTQISHSVQKLINTAIDRFCYRTVIGTCDGGQHKQMVDAILTMKCQVGGFDFFSAG